MVRVQILSDEVGDARAGKQTSLFSHPGQVCNRAHGARLWFRVQGFINLNPEPHVLYPLHPDFQHNSTLNHKVRRYSPTKWAMRGLADTLRNELIGFGVTVRALFSCWGGEVAWFEAGSYFRLIDFMYHSTLGLGVIKKKKKVGWCRGSEEGPRA